MKLFQIEEPDGSPAEAAEGPGAAVGIDLAGAVAFAVGGNAEILRGREGSEGALPAALAERLGALKARAERSLARPVTHAVIAAEAADAALPAAANAAGLTVLRLMLRKDAAALAAGASPQEAAALGAAICAEEMASQELGS
jgi:hypothetical protein